MIQDIWRLTKKKYKHKLKEINISEKYLNKKSFSRVIVSLVVQLLS